MVLLFDPEQFIFRDDAFGRTPVPAMMAFDAVNLWSGICNAHRNRWTAPHDRLDPDLSRSDRPRYLAIADLIAADIKSGRLSGGDRLPPQRKLAARLAIDFTTVARGYVEAQRRGLIESRVGQGTFVRGARRLVRGARPEVVDLSMNLPPEPTDPDLLDRMKEGVAEISRDLVALLRYQEFGGSRADKDAASAWLGRRALVPSQERVFVTPGAHAGIAGILSLLAKARRYDPVRGHHLPRRSLDRRAALGLRLVGLPMDARRASSLMPSPTPAQRWPPKRYTSIRRFKIRRPLTDAGSSP